MPILPKDLVDMLVADCAVTQRDSECRKYGIYFDPHRQEYIQTPGQTPIEFEARAYTFGLEWLNYRPASEDGSRGESWSYSEIKLCNEIPDSVVQMDEEAAKTELTKYFAPFFETGIANKVDSLYKLMKRTRTQSSSGGTTALKTYSASDLETMDIESIQFVIDKVLPVGLTIFAAPSKTGKSWACIDICNAVATGSSWMGLQAMQGDALYLDLESSPARLKERLQKMRMSYPERMDVTHTSERVDTGLVEQLAMWCNEKKNPRLIIIDTMVKVQGSAKRGESSYERDSRLLGPLQQFAMNRHVAIILVTHKRKQSAYMPDDPFEGIMGSQGQMGIADTTWMISGKRTEEEKHLLTTGRDIEQMDLTIKQNPDTMRWYLIGDTEELALARERQRFEESPLVRTIKKYCTPTWTATAQELINIVADETGEYPATDKRAMGVLLRGLAVQLKDDAGITIAFPKQSDNPKRFKFRQHGMT